MSFEISLVKACLLRCLAGFVLLFVWIFRRNKIGICYLFAYRLEYLHSGFFLIIGNWKFLADSLLIDKVRCGHLIIRIFVEGLFTVELTESTEKLYFPLLVKHNLFIQITNCLLVLFILLSQLYDFNIGFWKFLLEGLAL